MWRCNKKLTAICEATKTIKFWKKINFLKLFAVGGVLSDSAGILEYEGNTEKVKQAKLRKLSPRLRICLQNFNSSMSKPGISLYNVLIVWGKVIGGKVKDAVKIDAHKKRTNRRKVTTYAFLENTILSAKIIEFGDGQ